MFVLYDYLRSNKVNTLFISIGIETVILAEVAKNMARIGGQLEIFNDHLLFQPLDKSEEKWEAVAVRLKLYWQLATQYYNTVMQNMQFQVENQVICKVQELKVRSLDPTENVFIKSSQIFSLEHIYASSYKFSMQIHFLLDVLAFHSF